MQEIVTFYVNVQKDFPAVTEAVTSYLTPEEWEEERIRDWCRAVRIDPANDRIVNDHEGKMYTFDYEEIFPHMIRAIAATAPDSEFTGHAEYYNDDMGVVMSCDFKYLGQKLALEEFELDEDDFFDAEFDEDFEEDDFDEDDL